MSDLAVELTRRQMEESGELGFIREQVAKARGEEPAPAEADTADEPTEPVEPEGNEPEDTPDEPDEPTDEEVTEPTEPVDEEDDDVTFLDVSPEVEAFVNEKYGGDLGKALEALANGQQLIGRQGSELAELRRELAERDARLAAQLEAAQQAAVPYPEFPDEETVLEEPGVAVQAYRAIAEQAFARGDAETFQRSLIEWQGVDPVGMETYATLKAIQLERSASVPAPGPQPEGGVAPEVKALQEKYPDLAKPEVLQAIGEEAARWPTLSRMLQTDATPQERVNALEELYLLTARRTTSDTEQKARKKVALRVSEEARQARQEAQVAVATRRGDAKSEVKEERTVPLGETGRSLDLNRLNAMLAPEDRV